MIQLYEQIFTTLNFRGVSENLIRSIDSERDMYSLGSCIITRVVYESQDQQKMWVDFRYNKTELNGQSLGLNIVFWSLGCVHAWAFAVKFLNLI